MHMHSQLYPACAKIDTLSSADFTDFQNEHFQVISDRSWESPQTLPSFFIGSFEHVERFRNLKFAVIRITDIQSTVLSSSEGITAIHLAFK